VLVTTLLAFIAASLFVIWRRYRALADVNDPSRALARQAIRQAWRWRRA
jgi:hypothetical protein